MAIEGDFVAKGETSKNDSESSVSRRRLRSLVGYDGFKSEDPVTGIERTVTIGESIGNDGFSFSKHKKTECEVERSEKGIFEIDEEVVNGESGDQSSEIERPPSPSMHLGAGLGIDKFDLYTNEIKFNLPGFDDENCGDYYKKMLEEYLLHPLLLKNYAKFLEFKGDLSGAKKYYHNIVLAAYASYLWEINDDDDEEDTDSSGDQTLKRK